MPGQLELEQVQQRVRRARSLLTGLLVGCYAATALATVVLATDIGSAWPGVLAAVLGVLLLLRGRLFRHRAQVAAPLLAAAVVFAAGLHAATATWVVERRRCCSGPSPRSRCCWPRWPAASAAGVGARPLNPRLARGLDLLETLLLLSVVPIGLAVWNVYTLLLELRA